MDRIAIPLGQQEICPLNLNHRFAGRQNRTSHIQPLLRNFTEGKAERGQRARTWVTFRNTRHEKLRHLSAIEQQAVPMFVEHITVCHFVEAKIGKFMLQHSRIWTVAFWVCGFLGED
jgi:hypothetical protein